MTLVSVPRGSRFVTHVLALALALALAPATAFLPAFAGPASAACPPLVLQPYITVPASAPVEVVAADFTGDGIPDLAATEASTGTIGIFPGIAPGGTFASRIPVAVGDAPFGIATGDLDADGYLDLVIGNIGANTVQVVRGLGSGTFAAPVSFPAGSRPYEVALGDFNSDGIPDVAVANNGEATIRVLIAGNDGAGHWDGTFLPGVAYPTTQLSLAIVAGDYTNDGILDLVATEYSVGSVALFIGNGAGGIGDGTFKPPLHASAGPEPYDLATGDFNEDGKLDLAIANGDAGGLKVMLGTGTGLFPVVNSYLQGTSLSGVAVADFDGDGITDLAASSVLSNALHLMRGIGADGVGNGSYEGPFSISDCCYNVHVIAADLDLDGKPDAVTCGYNSNTLSVFLDGCVPDPNKPVITDIRDVPNDQGGKVYVTWLRSALDATGGPVNSYRVWRLVPPAGTAAMAFAARAASDPTIRREIRTRADGVTEVLFWEALATLPAQRLAGYGYTAATPQDSMRGSNPWFTYRISALTANIEQFYDSEPDSGYSVDNIGPGRPGGFHASTGGTGTTLRWDPSPDADFEKFELHRSSHPEFIPSPATLVAEVTTTEYVDTTWDAWTYKLAARDEHGNVGEWASVDVAATTGLPGRPGTTWLAPPAPNPVRGALDVHYSLASRGPLSLVLFDQAGRRMRTLARGVHPAGEAHVTWDARNDAGSLVAPGLYYLELIAGGRRFVERVALVR
jgi:hypothetical protein